MSKIEWTDTTWNPVTGCTRVSPGCQHCYAERMARRLDGRGIGYDGTTESTPRGPRWSGQINLHPERLEEPLRWRKPRRVFVCSMSDLFHEDVPFTFIAAVYGIAQAAFPHTLQLLTKRPDRASVFHDWITGGSVGAATLCYEHAEEAMIAAGNGIADLARVRLSNASWVLAEEGWQWPPKNVWLGTSVEDQQRADERIPHLLNCPAAVRFLSCEPLLGPVDLTSIARHNGDGYLRPLDGRFRTLDWVIAGGESGPGSRPMDIAWARSIVEQCRDAGVACFVKQLGETPFQRERPQGWPGPRWMKPLRGGDDGPWYRRLYASKGSDPAEWPEDLRVREFPPRGAKHD